MDRRARAHLALFTVNLIYGLNYVVAKGLMPQVIGPSAFILLRVLGAGALFWAMRAVFRERVAWSDLPRLVLCALFGVALNQLMFFHGLMRTSPLNASIIMVTTPILVLVLSGLLIGERITWTKAFGVLLGAAGALGLVLAGAMNEGRGGDALGDLFILINATSYGIYLVLVRSLMQRYMAVTVMAWSFLLGLPLVLPFGLKGLGAVEWSGLGTAVWLSLFFVVVMVTFVAYLLNTWALRFVGASVVGTYIYLQPVLAAVFAWLFMRIGAERIGIPGEYDASIGWQQALCAALIFAGVHLVSRADRG